MDNHYFLAVNSNRVIESQGLEFQFDPITMESGVWVGVYKTDDEAQVTALQALADDPNSSGVYSLTQAEYDLKVKKKAQSLLNSKVLKDVSPRAKRSPSAEPVEAEDAEEEEEADLDEILKPKKVAKPARKTRSPRKPKS